MNRFAIMLTGYLGLGAIILPAFLKPAPKLIWNASASVPVGFYSARPATAVKPGDLVAAHAPAPIARLMAERHYLPLRVPMLKHVAAVSGQSVCRDGLRISIDGNRAAEARSNDRLGRPLPVWSGCRTLKPGEIFLLNPASPASFDGRYFGVIPARSVIAVLTPVWLPGDPDSARATAPGCSKSSPIPNSDRSE